MQRSISYLLSIFIMGVFFLSCGEKEESVDRLAMIEKAKNVFGTLPAVMPGSENDTPEIITLGEKLFFDNRLSINNTQACNDCHKIDDGGAGVDNEPTSDGAIEGKVGVRNSPTVFNAGYHFAQFWDGREADLEGQAKGPILNPDEMAMPDSNTVVNKFKKIPEYQDLFKAAEMDLTYSNIAEAIAAFERTLITKDRFEMFMKGNPQALQLEEIEGLALFMDKGCTTCHSGPLLGGNMYQEMGLMKPYNSDDKGRLEVTGNESDENIFKVPSLRNVALTGPYMHDGKVNSLEESINLMADIQLDEKVTKEEIEKIQKFLNALSDIKIVKAQRN